MTYFDKAINEYIEESDSKTPHFDLICYICDVCKHCPIKKEICEGHSPDEIEKILMEEIPQCQNDNIIRQSDNEKEAGEASGR